MLHGLCRRTVKWSNTKGETVDFKACVPLYGVEAHTRLRWTECTVSSLLLNFSCFCKNLVFVIMASPLWPLTMMITLLPSFNFKWIDLCRRTCFTLSFESGFRCSRRERVREKQSLLKKTCNRSVCYHDNKLRKCPSFKGQQTPSC